MCTDTALGGNFTFKVIASGTVFFTFVLLSIPLCFGLSASPQLLVQTYLTSNGVQLLYVKDLQGCLLLTPAYPSIREFLPQSTYVD